MKAVDENRRQLMLKPAFKRTCLQQAAYFKRSGRQLTREMRVAVSRWQAYGDAAPAVCNKLALVVEPKRGKFGQLPLKAPTAH